MSNLLKRIITTVVGVPAVVCLLILLPQMDHLAFSIVAVVAAGIGSFEMGRMLFHRSSPVYCLPAILPLIKYVELHFGFPYSFTDIAFALMILVAMTQQIWRGHDDNYASSIEVCAKRALWIFYPGYLVVFVIRILSDQSSGRTGGWLFLLMVLLVFTNDIFAYVFGRLFGRNNGGIVPVSPHKSVAGFVGGMVCCVGASILLCYLLFDDISVLESLPLGILVSITGDIGDLIESMIKRSASVKDSGNIIPGRGGILDCLDSIIATAPVFYLLLEIVA